VRNFNLVFLLSVTFIIAGCGMKYIQHSDDIQRYKDKNIEELIAEWGAPTNKMALPSGNEIYSFTSSTEVQEKTGEIVQGTRHYTPPGERVEIYSRVQKTCQTNVTTDKRGKVLSLTSQGSGCIGRWEKEK